MVAEFLKKLIAPKKRTLLLLTEADIANLSSSQIREYNNENYAVMLCSATQLERVNEIRGLKIAEQFRQGNIVDTIGKWDPLPEIILVSDRIPDAKKVEQHCTRAFLDTQTDMVNVVQMAQAHRSR